MSKDNEQNSRVGHLQYQPSPATASELVTGSDLCGPDVSDEPTGVVEEVGDEFTGFRQWINRWVFLKHQRPAAFKELQELLACHTETVSAGVKSTADGTESTAPLFAVEPAADASPIRNTAAPRAGLEDLRERQAFGNTASQ